MLSFLLYCILQCILFPYGTSKPLLIVHFMPWFELSPLKHWPDYSGMYYVPIPQVGYYNSADANVINWQLSLMTKAGIDGVMVYWMGAPASNPHPNQNNATNILWKILRDSYPNLKLAMCIDNIDISTSQDTFVEDLKYLNENYFQHPSYLKYKDGNPIMTIFPNSGWGPLTAHSIHDALEQAGTPSIYLYSNWKAPMYQVNFTGNTYDNLGVYNWVTPQGKSSNEDDQINECKTDNEEYYKKAKEEPYRSQFYIGSIYHGFSDHYESKTTGTTNPYNRNGFINEDYGYLQILYDDTSSNGYDPYLIQIPTWNDYTEGTMIEPNVPTAGCQKGCGDDTPGNPYNDLISIYKLFVDANVNTTKLKEEFEEITNKYFPH